jgi:hypothetical protein
MAFAHHPGLAALHQAITNGQTEPTPIAETVAAQVEKKVEIEEITKELQDDARLERPKWKGFG